MNYNLNEEDKKKVKAQFEVFLELQDEKKNIADAEKSVKETVAEIIEGKKTDAAKLLKLMQKKYNSDLESDEDVWSLLELITSSDAKSEDESDN